jgi:hypothetical protein
MTMKVVFARLVKQCSYIRQVVEKK